MRKDKRKLASFLLAIACVSCAVGGFVVGGKALKETNITAKAETTTCVMSQIGVLNSSTASVIQAYSILETEKPIVDSWSYKFTFEEGSGRGFLYNGEAHTGWTIKQPGRDMYIELGKTAAVGDYVIIDGSFYNADSDTRLSFSCKFQWNGEKWVDYVEEEKPEEDSKYTTYTITKIGANRDSSANVAFVYSLMVSCTRSTSLTPSEASPFAYTMEYCGIPRLTISVPLSSSGTASGASVVSSDTLPPLVQDTSITKASRKHKSL